ncbi:MAG: hypothetical protein ACM3MG_00920 [Bacillota bacterium]
MNAIRVFLLACAFLYFSGVRAEDTKPAPVKAESAKADKDEKSKIPQVPVYFSVTGNELKIKPPIFQYDLESTKGEKLIMGDLVFDNESLKPSIHGDTFKIDWNRKLIEQGELSLIDHLGVEKWKRNITGEGTWSYKFKEGDHPLQFNPGDKLRYCLRQKNGGAYTAVCSRWYGVESRSGELTMVPLVQKGIPRVIFQQEEGKLKGRREVTVRTPVQFFGSLITGDSYEFLSEPPPLVINDMSVSEDPEKVTLVGEMPKPLNVETEVIKGENYGSLTTALGFEKTIAEKSDLWKGQVKIKEGEIRLPGSQGGIFIYPLEITNPPTEKNRISIEKRISKDTYLAKDKIFVSDADGNIKPWEIDAPEKFKNNRVYLETSGQPTPHKAYLDVYRGDRGEASMRLTALGTASSQFSIFAEAHVSWWFNDVFDSPDYYFSRHRWGVSAKYFTSMTPLKEIKEGTTTLTVMQADLRYRLNPGLWERDETVGVIASYETITVGNFDVPKMGAGVFWARSMPKVFDSWLSKISYLNYPKWVDMEFINYMSSMNSQNTLGQDFVVNFHGKVLWTNTFFGEAGFGIKNYSATRSPTDEHLKLTTFYGTVGLGVSF